MTDTAHHELLKKFKAITKALDTDDLPCNEFRKELFTAYGVEKQIPQGIEDPDEAIKRTWRKELEFAKRCLKGRGPKTTEVFRKTGDLREVLLIEIGTHPDPPAYPPKPWLMGDWQFLAERIVDAILRSDMFPENDSVTSRHLSKHVVRVWPTRGEWRDAGHRDASQGSQVEVVLDRDDVVSHGPVKVRSFTDRWSTMAYNWIVLPTGPGVLGAISTHSDGIPAHLWTGFREDDGT